MRVLQNKSGSDSIRQAFLETRDIGEFTKCSAVTKNAIKIADTVPLSNILYKYDLSDLNQNNKYQCPFVFHKNGNERTASFCVYPDKNKFYCFGCNTGGSSSKLVSLMENIPILDAAQKIINEFGLENDDDDFKDSVSDNAIDKQGLIVSFSNSIRLFINNNANNADAVKFAEKICYKFDKLIAEHKINKFGLKFSIEKLVCILEKYKCQ